MSAHTADDLRDDDCLIAEMPDLRVEVSHSEDMVILQQDSSTGKASRVALHCWQVRMLAKHFGLLKNGGPSESLVVATLARRLRALQERIDHLSHYLHNHSDVEHADMEWEQTYSLATCEIADEFVADLDMLVGPIAPAPAQPGSKPAARPARRPGSQLQTGGV